MIRNYRVCQLPSWIKKQNGGVDNVILNLNKFFNIVEEPCFADIIHVHADTPCNQIDVAHNHGIYLEEDWGHSRYEINNRLFGNMLKAKEVIVPSFWYKEKFEERGIKNVNRIPNGVDLDRFTPKKKKGDYVLYVGNWNEVKNGITIVELAKKFPDILFKITTEQMMIVPDNVEFLGKVPYENIVELYNNSIFTISPFPHESFGIATLEAFASGKPVLGASGGGNSEIIEHKKTGYLFEDPDDMVAGANFLLDTENLKNAIKLCRTSSENYSWDDIAKRVAEVYDKVWKVPVSVVVLAHNNQITLERALKSIGNGPEIILGDASENHNEFKLERERFIYTVVDNKTIGSNRNQACELASQEFLTFCDGDDYLLDGKIAQLSQYLKQLPQDIGLVFGNGIYGKVTFVDAIKHFHNIELQNGYEITADMLLGGNFIPSGAVMFRKSIWEELRFDDEISFGEDYDFYLRILDAGYRIIYGKVLCYNYNMNNPDSISKTKNKRIQDLTRVLDKAHERKPSRSFNHNELGKWG